MAATSPVFPSEETRRTSGHRSLLRKATDALAVLSCAMSVARERRALMRLDDGTLKDIGLSRADAYREGTRPWWDLPGCR